LPKTIKGERLQVLMYASCSSSVTHWLHTHHFQTQQPSSSSIIKTKPHGRRFLGNNNKHQTFPNPRLRLLGTWYARLQWLKFAFNAFATFSIHIKVIFLINCCAHIFFTARTLLHPALRMADSDMSDLNLSDDDGFTGKEKMLLEKHRSKITRKSGKIEASYQRLLDSNSDKRVFINTRL